MLLPQLSSFIMAFLFLFSPLSLKAIGPLPEPTQLEEQFRSLTNENQRYQFFDELGKREGEFAADHQLRVYLELIEKLVGVSRSVGDADWVGRRGLQVIQHISEIKTQNIINENGTIPKTPEIAGDFMEYFVRTSEGFQYNYLSQSAHRDVLALKEPMEIETTYDFIKNLEIRLATPIDYIQREFTTLLTAAAFLYCRDFRKIELSRLRFWWPRLNADGLQRILVEIDNQIINAQRTDQEAITKSLSITHDFYEILFARYKDDYLNDWQYLKPLRTMSSGLVKHVQHEWMIPQNEVQFLVASLNPTAFVQLSNEMGNVILQKNEITPRFAQSIFKTFEQIKHLLDEKKYNLEASTFNAAWAKLRKIVYSDYNIEGLYKVNLADFQQLIIAFKNRTEFVAGMQTADGLYSLAFDYFQFDEASGYYVGHTLLGTNQFILRLKVSGKSVEGCLNLKCFKGTRIKGFKNYLEGWGEGPIVELTGRYQGRVDYANGQFEKAELVVEWVSGKLMGNFTLWQTGGVKLNLAFDMGIEFNQSGILYLAARVPTLPAIHILRGRLLANGTISGDWIATSRAQVGRWTFKKIKPSHTFQGRSF